MTEQFLSQSETNAVMESCTRFFGIILMITTPEELRDNDAELLERSEKMMVRLGDCRSLAENAKRPITLNEAGKIIAAVSKAIVETLENK